MWLVGGAIRDALLKGAEPKDFDLVVEGDAQPLVQHLWDSGISEIYPVVFERFGTARIQILGEPVELVCTRQEQYSEQSRKPDIALGTLTQDAFRRDFTVNSLFANISSGEIADPTGKGMADLESGILDTPLDPEHTFSEDPLRMLRAFRFQQVLGFRLADRVVTAVRRCAPRLQIISAERIREEFSRMMVGPNPSATIALMFESGLLAQFLPELEELKGVEQGSYHHLDVWGHTLLCLDNITSTNLLTRLAGLFHDIAKPETRFVDADGRTRFFGHEVVGSEKARTIMNRLKYSGDETSAVVILVRQHMRFANSKLSASAARRLIRDLGDHLPALLDLCEADNSAHHPAMPRLDFQAIRAKLESVAQVTPASTLTSPLDGKEIMQVLNLSAGRKIKEAKEFLCEQVLDGRLAPDDKEAAVALLLSWYSGHNRGH